MHLESEQIECMNALPISIPEDWGVITAVELEETLEYVFRTWPRHDTYVGVRISSLPRLNQYTYHLQMAMVADGPIPPHWERHVMSYDDRDEALQATEELVHLLNDYLENTDFTTNVYAADVLPHVADEFAPEDPPRHRSQSVGMLLRRVIGKLR